MGGLLFVGIFIFIGMLIKYICEDIGQKRSNHKKYKNGGASAPCYVLYHALCVKQSAVNNATMAEADLLFIMNSDVAVEYESKNGFSAYIQAKDYKTKFFKRVPSVSIEDELIHRASSYGYNFEDIHMYGVYNKSKLDHSIYKEKLKELRSDDVRMKTYA